MRYIAFDVETPNRYNNRISEIGIAVVEGGNVIQEYDFYVNPEVRFDMFNIALTGITPEMVEDEHNFYGLWQDIAPIMQSGVLVAHNAAFDMGVLSKCLHAYNIPTPFFMEYACTVRMARKALPDLENHRLNTVCDYFGIKLKHHNAGSDATACGEILCRLMNDGLDVASFIRKYDMTK